MMYLRLLSLSWLLLSSSDCFSKDQPLIFPIPSDVQLHDGKFKLDKNTFLLLGENSNKQDELLTRFLQNEIADKFEYSLTIKRKTAFLPTDKFILIGSISNPLVKKYCEQKGWIHELRSLGNEGYILSVSENATVIASLTNSGSFNGLASLRQIIQKEPGDISLPQLIVKDSPQYPFRGIKLYLPGKENIQFFKRFIRDFAALYKFNKIILELNANMRLDKHPELNIGAIRFARHLNSSRLDRPPGVHKEYQNSSHQDNADGQILEKVEVADLVNYMRKFNIEVIPELPSLTHSYYLLAGHEELAENLSQPYPDTYCPLKPAIYTIYFDVLDEYIDVIHPAMIHVGHDEWRMEKDLCVLCRGKDYGVLYANDLKKIHDHLAAKGIKTAIWGDHLLESVTEKDHQTWKSSTGYQYKIPGALRPEQVIQLIPKDIVVFNWFWNDINNDKQVAAFGLQQVYGNLRADINNWKDRAGTKGILGGAPSSWAATTEYNIGKDQLIDFLGAANLLWSQQYLSINQLAIETEPLINKIYNNLSGHLLPSEEGATVTPVTISFNASLGDVIKPHDALLPSVKIRHIRFNLSAAGELNSIIAGDDTKSQKVATINKDVSSIIFLHACSKVAVNNKAYDIIYDFNDTAEPLGWYEIVYDDGLIETIPIRYGVNILDWRWKQRILSNANEKDKGKYSQDKYAYAASAVNCSRDDVNPVTFFSFEWKNPRYGRKIKEVYLRSVNYKKGNENQIILLAMSISENEKITNAKGTEAQ